MRCAIRPGRFAGTRDGARIERSVEYLGAEERDKREVFAEFAYFHDFVQSFLFPPDGGKGRPLELFRHRSISGARVVLQKRWDEEFHRCFDMDVARAHLYVSQAGVAMFAIELFMPPGRGVRWTNADGKHLPHGEGPDPKRLMLADVQDFNEYVRRSYIPFIAGKPDEPRGLPHLVVSAFGWCEASADPPKMHMAERGASAPHEAAEAVWTGTAKNRFIPPFEHWMNLKPDQWKIGPQDATMPYWRHVVDERMPIVSWVSMSQPGEDFAAAYRQIDEGNWMRLCFVDKSGEDALPYTRAFTQDWEKNHCYDRFHYQRGETKDGPSRYLSSGYSLVAVGCGPLDEERFGYANMFDQHIQTHMRRHYFQMMLLAQMELATLLALSSRITRAVEQLERDRMDDKSSAKAEDWFRKRMDAIENDFLQFVHRFRFTGLSNQLQAHEMFEMIRANMRLPEIYQDLREEIITAMDFLNQREQGRQTEAANRLALIATIGVIGGLAFAFLGMNVVFEKDILKNLPFKLGVTWQGHVAIVLLTLSAFCGIAAFVWSRLSARAASVDREAEAIKTRLLAAFVVFLILAHAAGLLSALTPSPAPETKQLTCTAPPGAFASDAGAKLSCEIKDK